MRVDPVKIENINPRTLESVFHAVFLMRGVQTKIVNPAKNEHTEYDMSMVAHCHIKTIFHLGFQMPRTLQLCCSLSCCPISDSIKAR